jgi:DNA invertase Pin-like site-specific DNA recombinase
MKVARIYLRVSTECQDLKRQESIIEQAKAAGCYVAGVYREKASGARADRPELERMIADLQPGEIVIAEKMDRISRLPLPEAEALIQSIRDKGATLSIPGIVDLAEVIATSEGTAKLILQSIQEMLLKLALQMARDDYETRRERQKQGIAIAVDAGKYKGRKSDAGNHKRIIELRAAGNSIARTAQLCECSESLVKLIWKKHQSSAA